MPNPHIPKFHPKKDTRIEVKIIYNSLKHLVDSLNDGWELCGSPQWYEGEFRAMLQRESEIDIHGGSE